MFKTTKTTFKMFRLSKHFIFIATIAVIKFSLTTCITPRKL